MGIVVETGGAEGETQGAVVGSRGYVDRVADDVVEFNVFCEFVSNLFFFFVVANGHVRVFFEEIQGGW